MRFHLLILVLVLSSRASAEDLTVLPPDRNAPPAQMLRRYLSGLADEAFARRRETYRRVETPEQLKVHQQRLRAVFLAALGPMPARTPLNARTVGEIDGDGFQIEKVVFESQPGHLVPANLYLPTGDGPFPAVVVPCGHSQSGKAAQQSICLALV